MKSSLQISTHYIQRATFEELSVRQFYLLAKLRQDIFIIEQQSIYQDLDGLDQGATHYLCWSSTNTDADLVGYARFRQESKENEFKIERVVFSPMWRGKGVGTAIMSTMIQDIMAKNAHSKIKLSAQIAALQFYLNLGFKAQGQSYDDGGIEHLTMYYMPTN
jgi:ElaA protein